MIYFLRFFLFNLLSALLLQSEAYAQPCQDVYEKKEMFGGKEVYVFRPSENTVLNVAELFGDLNQVFLGVTKDGHWYLWVGGIRYEGAYFPIPVFKYSSNVSDGYLVHFPNIPKNKIEEWMTEMNKSIAIRGFAMSCTSAACSALRSGFGIMINGDPTPIYSSTALNRILSDGFVDADGKPVDWKIYSTSKRVGSLSKVYDKAIANDIKHSLGFVSIAASAGMIVSVFLK